MLEQGKFLSSVHYHMLMSVDHYSGVNWVICGWGTSLACSIQVEEDAFVLNKYITGSFTVNS